MMRDYPHDPDEDFLRHQYERDRRGVGQILAKVEERGAGDAMRIANLLQTSSWGVGHGWALGEPVDDLRALLRPAIAALHQALDAGVQPDNFRLGMMLPVPIIAGDRRGALGLGELATDLRISDPPNDTVDHADLVIAAMARDDVDAAREHVAILREHLGRAATPPDLADALAHLDDMAAAVLDVDQDAWDAAADQRAGVVARVHSTSIEARRDVRGVFDFTGVALVRLAHAAGLTLPEHPIFAAELIRTL